MQRLDDVRRVVAGQRTLEPPRVRGPAQQPRGVAQLEPVERGEPAQLPHHAAGERVDEQRVGLPVGDLARDPAGERPRIRGVVVAR